MTWWLAGIIGGIAGGCVAFVLTLILYEMNRRHPW